MQNTPHQAQILDKGGAALARRLDMINRAKESIDMEYFYMYPCSTTGRLIISALEKKASQAKASGNKLRIRILLDAYEFWDVHSDFPMPLFIKQMREKGIDVVIYHKKEKGQLLERNKRDHRKLFMIDDEEVITGGRNLSDDYFGLAEGNNWIDKDMWVKGPIARDARWSMNSFWFNEINSDEDFQADFYYNREGKPAIVNERILGLQKQWLKDCLTVEPKDELVLKALEGELARINTPEEIVTCPSMKIAGDLPYNRDATRYLHEELLQQMSGAKKSLLIENYTFFPRSEMIQILDGLGDKKVDIELLTNRVGANDSQVLSYLQHNAMKKYANENIKMKVQADEMQHQMWYPREKKDWVIHSKAMVIDGKTTIVGSYNLDPRSEHTNAELSLIAENCPALAKQLEKSIRENMKDSKVVHANTEYWQCYDSYMKKNIGVIDKFIGTVFSGFY